MKTFYYCNRDQKYPQLFIKQNDLETKHPSEVRPNIVYSCMWGTNMRVCSGLPHRFMGQMDYNSDDPHLMGLASSLQYGLTNWQYPGMACLVHVLVGKLPNVSFINCLYFAWIIFCHTTPFFSGKQI